MSKIFSILLFTLFSANKCYSSDTLFLKRVIKDTPYPYYHAIYISNNYPLIPNRRLDEFVLRDYDSLNFVEQVPKLKKPLKKIDKREIPKNWVQLFLYKGEYFSYIASDISYAVYRAQLLDTLYIDYTLEGLTAYQINNFQKDKRGKYKLNYSNEYINQEIIIKLLSDGRAIFEFPKLDIKLLMVDASKLDQYRCVINYCKTDRSEEFEFDKIDFNKLEN